jgi:hypothetical protein
LDFRFWILDFGFAICDLRRVSRDNERVSTACVSGRATARLQSRDRERGRTDCVGLSKNPILDFGFWILDFGFWNLELGIWNLEFGTRFLEYLKSEIQNH